MRLTTQRQQGRRGSAYVIAIVLLTTMTTLAVGMLSMADMELQKSTNNRDVDKAQLASESGQTFIRHTIGRLELPADTNEDTLLANIYVALSGRLEETGNLDDRQVCIANNSVCVPEIPLAEGTFSCEIRNGQEAETGIWVLVTGRVGDMTRKTAVFYSMMARRSSVFDYGVASRGKISVGGSGTITGMTDPSEATVLSTKDNAPAIAVSGSGDVGGKLFSIGGDDSFISLQGGGLSVGGFSNHNDIRTNAVCLNAPEPEFPEIDTSPFVAMAVNEYTGSNGGGGGGKGKKGGGGGGSGQVLENIRIPAGTNPKFTNTMTINGVLYIEYPNNVRFAGQTTLNGIIVTEEPPMADYGSCTLTFRGGFDAPGVDALPDTAKWAALKEHAGTVMLCPGFLLDFKGNSGSVNGVIAADKLEFSGNSSVGGEQYGCVLNLTEEEMVVHGSAEIKVRRLDDGIMPGGFRHSKALSINPDSYLEIADN
ncbi:MAG: hypothetical protein ACLFVU_04200 [Phycisphaerae bacterium]